MKILQVPFNYYPEPVGGTEVYVAALAHGLRAKGLSIVIAAVGERAEYDYDGIPVYRFGRTAEPNATTLYGAGDPVATRDFVRILDQTAPDLVHLHALSPAVSASMINEIRQRGIPTVFTCHIPSVLCPRSTLLRHGTDVCDGIWGLRKCSSCSLENHGLPRPLALIAGSLPATLGQTIEKLGWRSSAATVLRMTELQTLRRRTLLEFLGGMDRIIAVCGWMRDMLMSNGIPAEKIVLCRHGSTQGIGSDAKARPDRRETSLKIAFLGRLHPTKGPQMLIEAVRRNPKLPLLLDLYGIVQDLPAYAEVLRRMAEQDPRITFRSPVPNDQVIDCLQNYDILAVPSQWMETGPLVVYDAFSAGIPVIGSDRGGIAELVQHGHNGLLVPPADIDAWGFALARLCHEPELLKGLRSRVRPGRSMDVVADEVADIYAMILEECPVSAPFLRDKGMA